MLKPGFKFVSQLIIGPKRKQRPPTPTPKPEQPNGPSNGK